MIVVLSSNTHPEGILSNLEQRDLILSSSHRRSCFQYRNLYPPRSWIYPIVLGSVRHGTCWLLSLGDEPVLGIFGIYLDDAAYVTLAAHLPGVFYRRKAGVGVGYSKEELVLLYQGRHFLNSLV
ncbi:hypothetical protein Holit_01695 [Hollandina sp. SP2]